MPWVHAQLYKVGWMGGKRYTDTGTYLALESQPFLQRYLTWHPFSSICLRWQFLQKPMQHQAKQKYKLSWVAVNGAAGQSSYIDFSKHFINYFWVSSQSIDPQPSYRGIIASSHMAFPALTTLFKLFKRWLRLFLLVQTLRRVENKLKSHLLFLPTCSPSSAAHG